MSGTQRRIRFLLTGVFCVVLFGIGVSSTAVARQQEGGPEGALDFPASGTSTTERSTTAGASDTRTVHALDAVGNESGASNAVGLMLGGKSSGPGGSGGGNGGKGKNK